jgi:hypothetical protein
MEDHMSNPSVQKAGLLIFGRICVGYILAVVTGGITFAAILALFSVRTSGIFYDVLLMSIVFGLLYRLPYTALGWLAFRYVFPRNTLTFLLIGMFCPLSALMLFTHPLQVSYFVMTSVPVVISATMFSGLCAAYIFGAIGLGYGFGRWKLDRV